MRRSIASATLTAGMAAVLSLIIPVEILSQMLPRNILSVSGFCDSGVYGRKEYSFKAEDKVEGDFVSITNRFSFDFKSNSKEAFFKKYYSADNSVLAEKNGKSLMLRLDASADRLSWMKNSMAYFCSFQSEFDFSEKSKYEIGLAFTNSFKYGRYPAVFPYVGFSFKSRGVYVHMGLPVIIFLSNERIQFSAFYFPVVRYYLSFKYRIFPFLAVGIYTDSLIDKVKSRFLDKDDSLYVWKMRAGPEIEVYLSKKLVLTVSGGFVFFGRDWVGDSVTKRNNVNEADPSFSGGFTMKLMW